MHNVPNVGPSSLPPKSPSVRSKALPAKKNNIAGVEAVGRRSVGAVLINRALLMNEFKCETSFSVLTLN